VALQVLTGQKFQDWVDASFRGGSKKGGSSK
jgi:hypothetical protein